MVRGKISLGRCDTRCSDPAGGVGDASRATKGWHY